MKTLFILLLACFCIELQAQIKYIGTSPLRNWSDSAALILQQNTDLKTLAGNYSGQITTLQGQVTTLTTQLATANATIAKLQGQVTPPPVTTNPATVIEWKGTFPKNMSWPTSGPCGTLYNNPFVPNTAGSPTLSGVSGFSGLQFNTGYNNDNCTIDSLITRYAGKKSAHLVVKPFSPAMPGCTETGTEDVKYDSNNNPIPVKGAANVRAEVFMSGNFGTTLSSNSEVIMGWSMYFPSIKSMFPMITGAEGSIHQIYSSAYGNPTVSILYRVASDSSIIVWLNGTSYNTGIKFIGKKWIDFVEHIVPGTYTLNVTINGVKKTFTHAYTWYGGTPKWGVYHWPMHLSVPTYANAMIAAGTPQLEMYLGPIKIIYNTNPSTLVAGGESFVQP